MTEPDTARCSCSHKITEHQVVTRDVRVDRKQKSRYRQALKSAVRREHCLLCDCRSPR